MSTAPRRAGRSAARGVAWVAAVCVAGGCAEADGLLADGARDSVETRANEVRAPSPWYAVPRLRASLTALGLAVVAPEWSSGSPHKRVEFEPVRDPALEEHRLSGVTRIGYEAGITLLDFDGDADLDLFVGSTEPALDACVYRNDSEPGAIAFARDPDWCIDAVCPTATAIDLDEDGAHELVALADDGLQVRWAGGAIRDLPLHPDFLSQCDPLTAAPFDVDLDGDLDLVVACMRSVPDAPGNMVWLRDGEELLPTSRADGRRFVSDGTIVTLAFGMLDVNRDGLVDLLEINDSFSTNGRRNPQFEPGGVRYACAPGDECTSRAVPFSSGPERWGSFMGLGNLRVEGVGEALVLADWGPVRLVLPRAEGFVDLGAVERGFPLGVYPSELAERLGLPNGVMPIFSWGVVIDDFDADGRDDAFVVEGAIREVTAGALPTHRPAMILQTGPGAFTSVRAGAGFHDPADEDDDVGRAALAADLDADGALELVIAPAFGAPRIFSARRPAASTDRCTIKPHPTVVPSWGFGYSVQTARAGAARWAVQGQARSTASPWLTAPETSGSIVFPSGYRAEFDCGTGGAAIHVVEPAWLSVEVRNDVAVVSAADGRAVTGAGVRTTSGEVRALEARRRGDITWEVQLPAEATHVMVQVGARWVGRWFALSR